VISSVVFQAQYVFLHHVMLESLLLGDVTYPAVANFADTFQRLRQPKRPSKHSIIEQQFDVGAIRKSDCELMLLDQLGY